MSPLPTWLRAHLEATGRLDTDGVRRAVSAAVCRTCGAHVLRGLDDDRCAGVAICDPEPVDATGEALAQLAGRATYDLARRGDRFELDFREPPAIAGHPAGCSGRDVLAAHRCHSPCLPTAPAATLAARTTSGCTGPPPF